MAVSAALSASAPVTAKTRLAAAYFGADWAGASFTGTSRITEVRSV